MSVKNGAELLDRLVKDIVSESAASYISILDYRDKSKPEDGSDHSSLDLPTAFALEKFIPILEERLDTTNPFTRTFLVSWLSLLDTIPDLELVSYLPAFLAGIFIFLGDLNRDVFVATQGLLERFLTEIKKIAKIKKGIAESRRSRNSRLARTESQADSNTIADSASNDNAIEDVDSTAEEDQDDANGDWIPGQDVHVEHTQILDILLKFINVSSTKAEDPSFKGPEGLPKSKEEEIGIVALRWIDSFFEISPEDILQFVPRLLSQVLPALSAQSENVRATASRVNRSLMDYIVTLEIDTGARDDESRKSVSEQPLPDGETPSELNKPLPDVPASSKTTQNPSPTPAADLDYAAAVNALTLQFLNEHEETRVAALGWLIMLHKKAPMKVLAFNDGTFPALLKTLSDPADAVVIRDLQLLSQISINSDDSYFASFMVALLQLFSTDRKLLEIRGNLIIRQLCINLQPERIYRTLADCIEKDEDVEFASIMVQNLNNNLITAPELAELRKRLRNPDSKDGQVFFVALFRAWCYNAVATFSLCLLAQAYEQAYHLLQVFADLEMTVNMLIQIDKLVQLLESPVFTCKPATRPATVY
jgi:vacuole morphology and inheritance protein 14